MVAQQAAAAVVEDTTAGAAVVVLVLVQTEGLDLVPRLVLPGHLMVALAEADISRTALPVLLELPQVVAPVLPDQKPVAAVVDMLRKIHIQLQLEMSIRSGSAGVDQIVQGSLAV
jgi:hypothetical protein